MASHPDPGLSLTLYQLRLPTFEGPLELLLRLIEREQLPISEISLLAVLDQFMVFVHELGSLPPEAIADFVAVAGRLSVLKSRSLLPRPLKVPDEIDEIDIVRQLHEYRALKMAAQLLVTRQVNIGGAFEKGGGIASPPPSPKRTVPQAPTALSRAVERWLTRLPPARVDFPSPRIISLKEMIFRIVTALERSPTLLFDSIHRDCESRQDIAVAFLGVLTLLRRQAIQVAQPELFGPITLVQLDRALAAEASSSTPLRTSGNMHAPDRP